jgi:hypothetical protein
MSKFSNLLNDEEEIKEKCYKGIRSPNGHARGNCIVTVDGKPLRSIWEQPYETVPEFEWGSAWGRGCKNLAVSILHDIMNEEDITFDLCNLFRKEIVSRLPIDSWTLKEFELLSWVDTKILNMEKQRAKAIA